MEELSFILLLIGLTFTLGAWQDGVPISSHLSQEKLKERELGRFQNHDEDHLRLLAWNDGSLLIGARDALFNLTSHDLKINSILNWTVSRDHQEMCQVKGQKDADCHNFIRVFHGPIHHHHPHSNNGARTQDQTEEKDNNTTTSEEKEEKWIVCGTNAFKPRCRLYDPSLQEFSHEISGIGYSPFDPTQTSTSVLHHGAVYAATVADFGGTDSLIYKNPLRTEQNDLRHLSSPSFVSSLSHGDLALFFFRELAVEHTNCGKVVYSRVGRLCRHDSGSKKHKDRFTTFLKARLNCSVPGEFPFYFDHIQGTSSVFLDNEKSVDMIYAVFTTPENSIGASAICAFSLPDMVKAFDGPFKGQTSEDSNWLPVPSADVPSPRPATCHSDPSHLPDAASVAFHKAHPLMDEIVQGTLALVYASNKDRFRVVEVDHSPEMDSSRASSSFHILYIGTESGKVLKVIIDNSQNTSRQRRHNADEAETHPALATYEDPLATFSLNSSLISASWQVSEEPIKTLRLIDSRTLLVGTETRVLLLPTNHCTEYKSCRECIHLRDPHCYWDMDNDVCISMQSLGEDSMGQFDLRQDIQNGDAQFCPQESTKEPEKILEPAEEVETEALENGKSEEEKECPCSCPVSTEMPPVGDFGNNRIPELDGHFRFAGGGDGGGEKIEQIDVFFGNEVDRVSRNDLESSSVKSGEEYLSGGSIAVASVGSAFIALMIGFLVGFAGSRWLAKRKNQTKTAATNAQLAASMNEQSQRLTAKPIDFVVNVNNWNGTVNKSPPKNNLNTDTLEKTVKKIYI